jgi:hypothetical protein
MAPASAEARVGTVRASLLFASLAPCAHFLLGSTFRPEVCTPLSIGGLSAEASGVTASSPSTVPWLAVGPEVALGIALVPWLALRPYLRGDVVLTQHFLRIRDGSRDVDVWASGRFAGAVGVDTVVRFP